MKILAWTGIVVLVASCRSGGESKAEHATRVTLAEMPAAARATAEKLTSGGSVEKIDREEEKGRVIYDVEATVGGRHVEYTITVDGMVLGTETTIAFADMPEPVRASATKYFGSSTGLTCMKCVEDGETLYEVAGTKAGKKVEASFEANGELEEEE